MLVYQNVQDIHRRASNIHSIFAVQLEYSLFSLDIEKPTIDVLKTCQELGIAIACYSPLGCGMLTRQIRSSDDFDANNAHEVFSRFSKDNFSKKSSHNRTLESNCTTGQLTLAWILA
ncbi:unnamed protein product [Adineta ricciae]|uniref:NADP-dependent oxidoreductase domain-containing protein n=1 Tax=Adineta ricciae TaxID=249248 RepID=A0A815ADC2_ADIRI|nr:unnamed protein product [Adineta ricciae]CAF1404710.1 unnamed protein product [Adineta ricciae]